MLQTMTQKELAERVDVTENTMGKWCAEWRPLLAAHKSTQQEVLERLDRQINKILEVAEKENRVATPAELDSIAKLNKTRERIDGKIGLATYITVFTEYNNYVMGRDPKTARENNKYQDEFINLKANGK